MGGDNAPKEIVVGAVESAAGLSDVKILLVGQLAAGRLNHPGQIALCHSHTPKTILFPNTCCQQKEWAFLPLFPSNCKTQ